MAAEAQLSAVQAVSMWWWHECVCVSGSVHRVWDVRTERTTSPRQPGGLWDGRGQGLSYPPPPFVSINSFSCSLKPLLDALHTDISKRVIFQIIYSRCWLEWLVRLFDVDCLMLINNVNQGCLKTHSTKKIGIYKVKPKRGKTQIKW